MTVGHATATTGARGADWLELARKAGRSFLGGSIAEVRRELLVVELAGAGYAIPIERVREIVQPEGFTRIPRTPSWIVGAVALRGEIVEVVDLRQRLRLPAASADRKSRVVVIHAEDEGVAGVLVDAVTGVLRASDGDFVACDGGDFRAVGEMVRVGEAFVGVIELDRVLGASHVA